jgi:hypothetical protein
MVGRHRRSSRHALVLSALLLSGCIAANQPLSEADQRACDKLIDVVRRATTVGGSIPIDNETAAFAVRKQIAHPNITPTADGRGYSLMAWALPITLLAAAGYNYRNAGPEEFARMAEAGRRCDWTW